MSDNWVEGSYESGADGDSADQPTPEAASEGEDGNTLPKHTGAGIGIGQGEPSSFEPEEDPDAVDPAT